MKFSTGIEQLDKALNGGLPAGVSEIFGADASGKSTLCFSVMREASTRGLPTSIIHSECYPDKDYMKSCGVYDTVSVIPTYLETAFEATQKLLRKGVKVVVIDSLTGFECYEDFKNLNVGERVRFAKSACIIDGLEEINPLAKRLGSTVIVTNQLRTPIGNLNPKPTSAFHKIMGGLSACRIQTFREEARNEFGELAYIKVRFHIKKCLKSPPNRKAWGFLFNRRGFDPGFELLREMINTGFVEPAGSYFRLPDGSTLGPGYLEASLQMNGMIEEMRNDYKLHGEGR